MNEDTDKQYMAAIIALQDLLCELRIDETELVSMGHGYSPDYPGNPFYTYATSKPKSNCKVQISQKVAEKIIKVLKP